jgi:hypothetical protein
MRASNSIEKALDLLKDKKSTKDAVGGRRILYEGYHRAPVFNFKI